MENAGIGFIASLLACLLCSTAVAHASVRTPTANAFYNSAGVDTHLTFANTTYGEWPRLVSALQDLGVRHLADGAYGNPAPSWAWFNELFESRVELAARRGMRFAFEMGKPGYQGGSIAQLLAVMQGPLRNSVEAIEDPNEFDSPPSAGWAQQLANYDRRLYAAVKASPRLRSLPVIGPSLAEAASPAQLGDQQSWLDFGAIHPYTGGLSPTSAYIESQLQRITAVSGDKPVWATEAGFSDALNAPAGQQPISEYAAAVYLLRELLANFQAGVRRTYVYELVDDAPDPFEVNIQDHYGLLRSDYTPKPAFTALKNLLALVGEQTPAAAGALALDVLQGPGDLSRLVLQRSDNTYVVILWRQAPVWDVDTRTAIPVAPMPVLLRLPGAISAAAADPIATQDLTPLPLADGELETAIGADPLVVLVRTRPHS